MKILPLFLIFALYLATFHFLPISYAQQNLAPVLKSPAIDIKSILHSVSPLIDVEYQGESILVLKADENILLLSNGTLAPFWNSVDLVKHYGYSLNDVTTSGMGSQGNPTRFYAILSKP